MGATSAQCPIAGTMTSLCAAMKLSPSQASPKMPITATTPARSVAVFGISSTFTRVSISMIAATAIITISITIGMPSGALRTGQLAQLGKEPEEHNQRHAGQEEVGGKLAAGFSGGRSAAAFGAGIWPASRRA
jgi:hypothetical protein